MQINSWRTLPIGKYLKIAALAKDESLEEIDRQVKVVAILNDMAEEDVLNLPIDDFSKLSRESMFLRQTPNEDHSKIADSYKIGDFNLIPTQNLSKITTAQYIDFQSFSKDAETNMVELLSCFLVPKGMKYNQGYEIADVQKAIRENLSVVDTLSLSAFFLKQLTGSIKDSIIFSKAKAKKIQNKEKREETLRNLQALEYSLRNGDGLQM